MNNYRQSDIIITGLQPWEIGIGSNCRDLALELSKTNRVLYVNYPLDFYTSFFRSSEPEIRMRNEIIGSRRESMVQYNANLWYFSPRRRIMPISRLRNDRLFDKLNLFNNRRFAKDIREAAGKLGFKDYLLFNDGDMFRSFYLKELLKPRKYIYYTRDNLLAVDYWKVQGTRIEPQHMAKADLVTSNSLYLAKLASKYNSRSCFIGQGCDLKAFDNDLSEPLPGDMAGIGSPVIGYIGALKSLRLDIGVIEHIALSRKDWNIVLIGPEDEIFRNSVLHSLPNVHFLGSKDEKRLPVYLKSFDVAINPQLVNDVTIGNYPRKIDEYLAMGKPVVATKTEAMELFRDFVSLPVKKDEWPGAIENQLINNTTQAGNLRKEFARTHTWAASVEKIFEFLINK